MKLRMLLNKRTFFVAGLSAVASANIASNACAEDLQSYEGNSICAPNESVWVSEAGCLSTAPEGFLIRACAIVTPLDVGFHLSGLCVCCLYLADLDGSYSRFVDQVLKLDPNAFNKWSG